MIDKSMKKKRSAHFFSHMIKVGFAVLLLTCGVLGFCAAPAAADDWSGSIPSSLFYYENVEGLTGTYSNMCEALTLDDMNVLNTVANHPAGVYRNVKTNHPNEPDCISLKKLDAEITMYVHDNNGKIIDSVMGNPVLKGENVSFKVNINQPSLYLLSTQDSSLPYVGLEFTSPDGQTTLTNNLGSVNYGADSTIRWGINKLDDNLVEGKWTVQSYFVPRDEVGYFASYTPKDYLHGQKYSFYITDSIVSISSDIDYTSVGGYVTITLSGKPNAVYYLEPNDKYEVALGQEKFDYDSKMITIGKDGVATLILKAVNPGEFTLQLCDKDNHDNVVGNCELTFIMEPVITVDIDSSSCILGKSFNIHGTKNFNDDISLYIKGTWLNFMNIDEATTLGKKSGCDWSFDVDTSRIRELNNGVLNGGAYLIYAVSIIEGKSVASISDLDDSSKVNCYATASIAFKEPYLKLTSAPKTIAQGENLEIRGVAEGNPTEVQYYIFGPGIFIFNTVPVNNGVFNIILSQSETASLPVSQHHLVIHHPLYDGQFNIGAYLTDTGKYHAKDVVCCMSKDWRTAPENLCEVLFNAGGNYPENYASALCDALDSLSFDDIYLKTSFAVTLGTPLEPFSTLHSGWNFVSVPKKLSADYNTAAELFAGVNTNNNAILSYNTKTQVWEQVKADTEIVPLNAYYIYSVNEKVITPTFDTGAHVPASKAVHKGWNAVGISAEKPMTAADAFNNINWRTYLIWNPTIQKYDTTIIKGNKAEYSEDTFINLWKGGWLFMDEDNTIIGYA